MEGDPNCKLCRRCDQATNVCIISEDQPSEIMVIGEAPTAKDDERGFLTTSRLLKELLIENEIEPEECFITNAVACYGEKAPTKAQLRQCGHWLNKQIEFCKPKFVLLCGNAALQAITGSPGISKKRGRPFEKDGILYVPTLSMGSAFYDPELRYQISSDIHLLKAIIDNGEIPRETELDYTIVDSLHTLKKLKRALYGTVSVDIETNSLNPWQIFKYVKGKPPVKEPAKIISIGFGTKEGQFIIPVNHIESMWTEDEVAEILDEIKPLLDKCYLVGHNGKFDFLWLWVHFNLILHLDFDTMLAHYLLDENSRHGLKEVARKFCGAPDWDVDMQTKASGDAPLDKHSLYLAHDLYYTRKLKFKFKKMLDKDVGVNQVFNHIMMPCARLFTEIEYDGMVIDMEKFDDASKFLHDRYDEHLKALAKWEPKNKKLDRKGKVIRFNWGSPTQLQKLLFDDLGIEPLDYGKSGNPSVSESVLKRIDHPMVGDLLKFREAKQQLSFFIEGWEPYLTRKYINGTWVDILHPRFKLHGTTTGRLSSEKPSCVDGEALVQVPGGTKKLKDIKVGDKVYCYDEDNKLKISEVTWKKRMGVKDTVEIKWRTGGKVGYLNTTPDHEIRMVDGSYRKAEDLTKGDRLSALQRKSYKDKSGNTRDRIVFSDAGDFVDHPEKGVMEYRIIFYLTHGYLPPVVHHEDSDTANNDVDNLKPMSRSDHQKLHMDKAGHEFLSKRGVEVHKNNPHIVEAAIKKRKEWSKKYLPQDLAVKVWEKYRGKPRAADKAAEELGVTRKTLTKRLTEAGFTPGCEERQNHKVVSVTKSNKRVVYDIEVKDYNNFIVNEVSVHNCQQIPRDKRIRSLITAEPGWTLVECDLSQIELRIAAELANERKLLHYFITGVDVHWSTAIRELERGGGKGDYAKLIKETAGFLLTNVGLSPDLDGAEILLDLWESVKKDSGLYHKLMKAIEGGTPEERWELLDNALEFEDYAYTARAGAGSNRELDIDFSTAIEVLLCAGPDVPADYNGEWKELRKKAKAVNFGFLFSMFWKKFKMYARDNYGVSITDSQAKDAYDFFFSEYKDLRPWHNEQKKFARKYGYVRSLSGRKRRLPKALLREDTPERRAAERQAINSPVQGFANDINLMTAIQLRKEYSRDVVKICGTVHDAILMRVRNDKVLEVAYRCLEIMRKPELFDTLGIKLTVPIEGEGRIGPWGSGVSLEKWKQP